MATEKLFNNVRLGMKVDTLSNWSTSTLILKRGELAFATTAATAGTGLTEPVVMVKIGDGTHKFSELGWDFYAKASDVLEVAKDSKKLTTFVNDLIKGGNFADNTAMTNLAKRVEDAEKEIDLLNDSDENKAGSVANSIKAAIEALDLANTYAAKEHDHAMADITGLGAAMDKKVDKVDGKSLVNNDEITKLAGISAEAKKVEKSDTNGYIKIDGVETVVYAHPEKHAMDDITGLNTALAGKADKATTLAGYNIADAYTKDEVDGFIEAAKKHADDNDANFTYSIAYDTDNKKIQLVGANGGATTEIDATAFIKDGMIETVALSDDGENLIITWNTDAGKENSVTTIPLSGLVDVYTGVDGTTVKVDVSSKNEIGAEVKAGTITTSHIAAKAGIVKTQLADDVQESLGKADTALQPAALGDYYTKTQADAEFTDATEVDGQIDAKIQALSLGTMSKETAANYYTKTEADEEFTNATEVDGQIDAKITALKLADTYQAKGAYATAEQGGKADTAIQTVDGATGSGLKATKTGTSVTVDFDDSITFVFNCGTSADIE